MKLQIRDPQLKVSARVLLLRTITSWKFHLSQPDLSPRILDHHVWELSYKACRRNGTGKLKSWMLSRSHTAAKWCVIWVRWTIYHTLPIARTSCQTSYKRHPAIRKSPVPFHERFRTQMAKNANWIYNFKYLSSPLMYSGSTHLCLPPLKIKHWPVWIPPLTLLLFYLIIVASFFFHVLILVDVLRFQKKSLTISLYSGQVIICQWGEFKICPTN